MICLFLSLIIHLRLSSPRRGSVCKSKEETDRVLIERTVASLTSPHCRCPLAASISRRAHRMREQLAATQAERRILGSSTVANGPRCDPATVHCLTASSPLVRSFARPLGFDSASAAVASRRQIVALTTCDYPRTERSGGCLITVKLKEAERFYFRLMVSPLK